MEQFRSLLNRANIDWNVNLQAEVTAALKKALMLQDPNYYQMLHEASEKLRIAAPRLEMIAALENPMDQRQALKIRRAPTAPTRLADEQCYPTTGWLGEYLHWCGGMEVPMGWHFWSGVAILAACCRRNFYLHTGSYPIFPSIYVCIVGPSGMGKSLCMQSAAKPMLEAVNRILRANPLPNDNDDSINLIPDRVTVATFLDHAAISYKAEAEVEIGPDGKPKKVRAKRRRRTDSAVCIIKDELCAFIGRDSIDGGAWIEMLLDLSNGQSEYTNPTQAKVRKLEGVAVTCLFGSAEENIRSKMHPSFMTGGMMGRIMWIHRLDSHRVFPTTAPLDPLVRDQLAKWLADLTRGTHQEILRHPETDRWWETFYYNWAAEKEDGDGRFSSWHNRMKDQILRLAMILALSEGRFTVQLSDLEMAQSVISIERSRFDRLFGMLSISKDGEVTNSVLDAIPEPPDWRAESDLVRSLSRKISRIEQLTQSIGLLHRSGEIRSQQRMVSGRIVRMYQRKGRLVI